MVDILKTINSYILLTLYNVIVITTQWLFDGTFICLKFKIDKRLMSHTLRQI